MLADVNVRRQRTERLGEAFEQCGFTQWLTRERDQRIGERIGLGQRAVSANAQPRRLKVAGDDHASACFALKNGHWCGLNQRVRKRLQRQGGKVESEPHDECRCRHRISARLET